MKPPRSLLSLPPILNAFVSLIPGLGQLLRGYITRAILIFSFVASLYGLVLWRLDDAKIAVTVLPPSIDTADLSRPQETTLTYAVVAIIFAVLGHLWGIFDAYVCAGHKPSPPRLGMTFLIIGTLVVGSDITEINIAKAVREIDDIVPRLSQILWPWNPEKILYRDKENFDGVALWETPCQEDGPVEQPEPVEGQPYLEIAPDCGDPSGGRLPNGRRREGTEVTLKGYNYRPNEQAELIINPASIPEFRVVVDGERVRVTPDDNGQFELSFVMPNFTIPSTTVGAVPVRIIVRQQKEIGSPKLVKEFWLSLEAIIETIFLALMATAFGLILAVPMSFVAARNLMATNIITLTIYYLVRLFMNVVRSIEPLIWALIAIVWVGPGPFAGVIALTIHTIAALGKLYSESIESIDDGPIEAIQATGADRLQTIMYAVVPQVVPPFVSFTIYRWDINVRMSTIIGAVGGGGIGAILVQWIRIGDYDSVGIAVWMIAIVVTILDYASARIRERYV